MYRLSQLLRVLLARVFPLVATSHLAGLFVFLAMNAGCRRAVVMRKDELEEENFYERIVG